MAVSDTDLSGHGSGASAGQVPVGSVVADLGRACLVRPDGGPIALRPKTWDVLLHLLCNAQRVVSRAELLDAVWPEVFVTDYSLTVCIAELRRALGDKGMGVLRTVSRRGYVLETDARAGADEGAGLLAATRPAAPPVLAVLPFINLSGDRRWDRLCDGLVEDMITDFARHPDLRVIARTSSFAWRDRRADVREIGRALGAAYLLEGSVQADGSRVDVTAQLIEAAGGGHVWANRYTREEEGVFAIQAEVVARVVSTVAGFSGSIARTELARSRRAPPASLRAYELYLLGYEQEAQLDRESTLRGIELLEAAVAADPGQSRAWTVLGFACGNAVANGWADDPEAMQERELVAIRRAAELDPDDGVALEGLGSLLASQGDLAGARRVFERAAVVAAGHADALALLAKYMVEVLGHVGAAERMTARAFALNPLAPPWYYLGATRVAYFAEDFERAVEFASHAPPLRLPRLFEILALAQLGRATEAEAALRNHYERFGPAGVREAMAGLPPLCAAARTLLDDGLLKAGAGTA